MTNTHTPIEESARRGQLPVSAEEANATSRNGARVNIPLNLGNWRHLPEEVQAACLWFHQHVLDQRLTWAEAAAALNYDQSVVFRVLKGTYSGSWPNVVQSIESFQRIAEERAQITRSVFVENAITRMVFAGLAYALANNSITVITGESRMGKTVASKRWRDLNNHGRSVFVTVPPYGGAKGMLRAVAAALGINRNENALGMIDAIYKAMNPNRILILDEGHRLLPSGRSGSANALEILRDIHDQTGCAIGILATARFDRELRKGEYMFEQLLGRIGMPVRLPPKIRREDIQEIVSQFIPDASDEVMDVAERIANQMGRLGILVETLKAGSKLAARAKQRMSGTHFLKALAIRQQMSGQDS